MKKKLLATIALSSITTTSSVVISDTGSSDSDQKVELTQLLPDNTELEVIYIGNRNKPTPTQIKGALKNKNWLNKLNKDKINEILNETIILNSDITTTSAIIKAKADSKLYKGKINVNFTIVQPTSLKKQFSNLNLGMIKTEGKDLSQDIIKEQLKQRYPKLNCDKIHIVEITEKSAKVVSDGTVYNGFVNITYSFDKIIDLPKQLNNTHLGTFWTDGDDKKLETLNNWIVTTIEATNKGININKIHISKVTKNSALVSGSSDTYRGQVTVDFVINESVALNKIIPNNTYLGTFKANVKTTTPQEITSWIIEQLKQKYSNLELSKIKIYDFFSRSAMITGNEDTYRGQVTVFYTLNQVDDLQKVLPDNTHIGTIYLGSAKQPTDAQIRYSLYKQNPDLDIRGISVSEITDHSAVIEGFRRLYTGSVNINFKVTNFIENTMKGKVTKLVKANDGVLYALTRKDNDSYSVFVKTKNEKTFTRELTGISGEVTSLTLDSKNNIYVSTKIAHNRGKVYKCEVTKNNNFFEMNILRDFVIVSLTTDNQDNVFAAGYNSSSNWVFKCDHWDKQFWQIRSDGSYGKLNLIITNQDGNVYARNDNNKFFKYDTVAKIFISTNKSNVFDVPSPVTVDEHVLTYFASDQAGNRYAANENVIYQMIAETTTWEMMIGITSKILSLISDQDGTVYIATVDNKIYQYNPEWKWTAN